MSEFGDPSRDAEVILKKIVEDFDELDRAIEDAIARLQASTGGPAGIEALLRAREAVRKGAALAREKYVPN